MIAVNVLSAASEEEARTFATTAPHSEKWEGVPATERSGVPVLDAAIVCIGGHYTMDRHDAVTAAELIGAPTVIPIHFNTFPPIETDARGR